MSENFNYKEVPHGYTHCMNEQCPRSAECLRFLVGLHVDSQTSTFSVVNPAYVANIANTANKGKCPYFRTRGLVRYALGITHLYDTLPHIKAGKIRKIIYNYYGKYAYYRIRNKERLINPEEQDYIRQVLNKEGIEGEPTFDLYVEQYDWS